MSHYAKAFEALNNWADVRTRGPLYMPRPADYSRPMDSKMHVTPEALKQARNWRRVEDALASAGAGHAAQGGVDPRHPLRLLLAWCHDHDGRTATEMSPERFPWGRVFPGVPESHLAWCLGRSPRAYGAERYREFIDSLTREVETEAA